MKIMKSKFLLSLMLLAFYSCSVDRFVGSGETISEIRNVNIFNEISSEGTFEVTITKGNEQSVEIIADDNIMSRVKTNVVNGKLKLELSKGNYRNVHLEAHITMLDIEKMQNSGTGNISAYGFTETESLKIVNSGAGNISLDGVCENLEIENEGSGNIYAFNMLANICEVDNRGSGEVEITCESNLEVVIEGSGDVYYRGNPIIDVNVKGSGSLINEN
jgi:hypothetical protein